MVVVDKKLMWQLLLTGLRVACVRVLFQLPYVYRLKTMHPLAYIEWFTPFRSIDKPSGMYVISPSTRQHQLYGEIIEISCIVRSCHLIPCACVLDKSWTQDNVVDLCSSFYFNSYIDMHTFCMVKLGRIGCIK